MPGPWQRKSGGVGRGGWARCSRCCSSDPGGVACVCSRTRAGCERLLSVLLLLAFSHKEAIKPFVRCFAPASLRMRAGRQRLILVGISRKVRCFAPYAEVFCGARMAEEARPAAAAAPPAHGSAAPAVANSAAADDAQAALASLRAIERSARVVATDAAILVGTAHHALQSVRVTAHHYASSPQSRPTPVPPRHSSRSTRRST